MAKVGDAGIDIALFTLESFLSNPVDACTRCFVVACVKCVCVFCFCFVLFSVFFVVFR